MNTRDHFALLTRYHLWATRRLFTHIDALPEADYRRDTGLFFRSVHGTLSHLLVADGAWYARFARGESPQVVLDAELEHDRPRLREALIGGASNWPAFVRDCPDERWASELRYRRGNGEAMALPFACPELDIVWMLVEEKGSAA
jgi:uncharacterized damage-inducible protein DinB